MRYHQLKRHPCLTYPFRKTRNFHNELKFIYSRQQNARKLLVFDKEIWQFGWQQTAKQLITNQDRLTAGAEKMKSVLESEELKSERLANEIYGMLEIRQEHNLLRAEQMRLGREIKKNAIILSKIMARHKKSMQKIKRLEELMQMKSGEDTMKFNQSRKSMNDLKVPVMEQGNNEPTKIIHITALDNSWDKEWLRKRRQNNDDLKKLLHKIESKNSWNKGKLPKRFTGGYNTVADQLFQFTTSYVAVRKYATRWMVKAGIRKREPMTLIKSTSGPTLKNLPTPIPTIDKHTSLISVPTTSISAIHRTTSGYPLGAESIISLPNAESQILPTEDNNVKEQNKKKEKVKRRKRAKQAKSTTTIGDGDTTVDSPKESKRKTKRKSKSKSKKRAEIKLANEEYDDTQRKSSKDKSEPSVDQNDDKKGKAGSSTRKSSSSSSKRPSVAKADDGSRNTSKHSDLVTKSVKRTTNESIIKSNSSNASRRSSHRSNSLSRHGSRRNTYMGSRRSSPRTSDSKSRVKHLMKSIPHSQFSLLEAYWGVPLRSSLSEPSMLHFEALSDLLTELIDVEKKKPRVTRATVKKTSVIKPQPKKEDEEEQKLVELSDLQKLLLLLRECEECQRQQELERDAELKYAEEKKREHCEMMSTAAGLPDYFPEDEYSYTNDYYR